MGFLGIFKSIEDLLYEVMTWLVFYPRTLWQVIRRPLAVAEYSDSEQNDAAADQYIDTLSPPIFLMLTILIGHAIELGFNASNPVASGALGKMVTNSEESLLVFRLILFSIFPLMFALAIVKRSDLKLDRKTLRGPFFSQCYIGAVYSLMLSSAAIVAFARSTEALIATAVILLVANIWYVVVEAKIIARTLNISGMKASGIAVLTLLKAVAINGLVSAAFFA